MARRRARRCWTYRTGGGLVRGYGRAHARASRRGDAEAARGVGLRSSGELGRGVSRARGHRPKTRSYEQTGWARLFHEHDVCDGTGDARPRERTCANGAVATCFSTPAARAPRSTRAIARECVRPCTRARTRLRMNEQIAMEERREKTSSQVRRKKEEGLFFRRRTIEDDRRETARTTIRSRSPPSVRTKRALKTRVS